MNQALKVRGKGYHGCFILTDQKLAKIIQVAKARLAKVSEAQQSIEQYNIILADDTELFFDNSENVLTLENSQKNPITRLTCKFTAKREVTATHEIFIDFDSNEWDLHDPIYFVTTSYDHNWAQETINALEEQIDKAVPKDIAYTLNKKWGNTIAIAAFIIFLVVAIILPGLSPKKQLVMQQSLVDEVIALEETPETSKKPKDSPHHYAINSPTAAPKAFSLKNKLRDKKFVYAGVSFILWTSAIIYTMYKY